MWLDSLRRLVEGSQRKRGSRGRAGTVRGRRPTRLSLERLEDRMVLSTLTVSNINDSVNFAAGDGSLRGEIAAANSGDTIQFSSTLAGQTIKLSAGELLINKNLSITGLTASGKPNITISGGGASRVFNIEGGIAGANVTLQNLTVTGGLANAQSANFAATGAGLFIYDISGTVTLNNLNINNNYSYGAAGTNGGNSQPGGTGQTAVGGGLAFFGGSTTQLVITNTTLYGNEALGGAGGQGGYGGTAGSGAGGNGNGYGGAGGRGGFGLGAGLYLNGGTIQLTSDTINFNYAGGGTGGNGGQGGATVSFHNGPGGAGGIGGSGQGAGVYVNSGTVLLSSDSLNHNRALGNYGGAGGAAGNRGAGGGIAGAAGLNGNGEGGGLFVAGGSVQLTGGGIQSNQATGGTGVYSDGGFGRGGGLYVSSGSVVLSTTTLLGNKAAGGFNGDDAAGIALGGGVYVSGGDVKLLRDALISNLAIGANSMGTVFADTGLGGGAAIVGGNLLLIDDTLAANQAIGGTGSSTVYNSIGEGGGIYGQGGTIEFINDTISGNTATGSTGAGGGLYIGAPQGPPAAASFANTIVAGDTAVFGTDVYGPARSSDHDLIQTYDYNYSSGFNLPGSGDLVNVPVNLAQLGNYGGPTQSMPLQPGSNGIDVGDTAATGLLSLPGLVDLWKGESNALDSVGTQNGTLQGSVTFATGEVGKAFSFNGTGGSVQFGPHAVGTNDFSLSFWIQTTNAGPQAVLGDRVTAGHGNFYGVRMNNGHVIVELDQDAGGTNYVGIVSSRLINDGLFHQVTIVRAGTSVLLYIDGILDSRGTSAGVTNLTSTSPLLIGAEPATTTFLSFSGKLDEIAFYNQALSGQQALAAYAGPITRGTDQRGGARVVGANVDIGATEYQYDVSVTGSAPSSATPGSTVTYNLTVTNKGLDPVSQVIFSDTLPTGVAFLSLSTPFGWAIGRPVGQTISAFSGAGLAPGASATFVVTATVNSTTPPGTVLTNNVSVSPTTDDSNPANNTLTLTTTIAVTQASDPGFELPHVAAGAYLYDPSGSPWTFTSSAGVSGNASAFTSGNPPAPQGTQVAFLQGTGTVSQAVNFAAGTYTISLDAAQRGNSNNGGQTFAVKVDGTVVGTITPTSTSYALYTTNAFTVTTGSHTISFVGLNPKGGDNTAFLDQVSIQAASIITPTPSGVDIHGQPHDAPAGQSIGPVVVAVVDANGNTVAGSNIPVTLSIYSGPNGAVLEGKTTVYSVNGVATFTNLALNEAGTYVLKATSGKLDPDYSNPFTIRAADVSDDVQIDAQKLHAVHGQPHVFEQNVTITNSSKESLHGPLALVLSGLPSGVTLQSASGSYQGSPYVDLVGLKDSLAAGEKVTITLSFLVTGLKDPRDLTYTATTLLGIRA